MMNKRIIAWSSLILLLLFGCNVDCSFSIFELDRPNIDIDFNLPDGGVVVDYSSEETDEDSGVVVDTDY
jgi:uncharacterized metal-binding protein